VKPGLERISGLLDMLARPDAGYPIIHIAGTNGKTSTSRMITTLLAAHGLDAGLFTSPHLDRVEQRYQLNAFPMTADQFAAAITEIAPIVDLFEERTGDLITYFELTAALAFAWFAESAVDVAAIEAGLGGRLDATNAATSAVAVVTNIGLEHTEYLGDTVSAIAAEKLAILDEGAVLVTGDLVPDALTVAEARAQEQGARWLRFGEEFFVQDARAVDRGWEFDLDGAYRDYEGLRMMMHGRHQITNFATAVAAVEAFFDRPLDEAAVQEAAATATSPGRMDILQRDPILLTDGAHNPDGMASLAAALREEFPGIQWSAVIGAMADKDLTTMLGHLRGLVRQVHAAAADSPRALPADEMAELAQRHLGVPATAHPSVAAAVAAAQAAGTPVLVTGSIYVVGEARRALGVT
jgi:dihydrofolate synthase/folylpolyglutamate synthase